MCNCSEGLTRRDAMKAVAAAAAAVAASGLPFGWAQSARGASAPTGKPKKVLYFTKSQGFQHSVVTRPKDKPDELSFSEKLMVEWGRQHGFDVTPTKDGRLFTPEKIAEFDVLMFYTTGDLEKEGTDKSPPMPAGGKRVLLDAIAGGKGFLGLHCASDTFHSRGGEVDPYIKMVGGEFEMHGKQQKSNLVLATKDFKPIPGLAGIEALNEEWYLQKNLNPEMQVLLVQDVNSMEEARYKNAGNYPQTWARMHGKGRVFYSSMGHREDVWQNPYFQKILMGGLAWAAGNVDADVKPNFKEVCPDAMKRAIKESTAGL
jgi:uncharacterized protein